MMAIEFRDTLPDQERYSALFESTGWNAEYHLSPRELTEALGRSWFLTCAWDGETLAGSGRVISDGVFHALIVDVIVLPEYQGRGIGIAIMRRLIEQCRAHSIRDVQLFCAKGKAGFYQRLGFRARPEEAPGMDLSST